MRCSPLNAVTGIVERRHTPPILANVLIEKRGNALSFCHRPGIQITTASQGEVAGEDFRLTTSAKKLQDILRAARRRHGDAGPTRRQARPESRQSRFNLQTLPAEDFPVAVGGRRAAVQADRAAKALKALLAKVQYAMAVQDIRCHFNGMLFIAEGQSAVGGHRRPPPGLLPA